MSKLLTFLRSLVHEEPESLNREDRLERMKRQLAEYEKFGLKELARNLRASIEAEEHAQHARG